MQDSNCHNETTWLQILMQTIALFDLVGDEALTLCDSGFDKGQRFVSVWQGWRQSSRQSKPLHYVGFDPSGLDVAEFAKACSHYPDSVERLALNRAWRTPLPGVSVFEFDDGLIRLTLFHMPLKHAIVQAVARVHLFLLDNNIACLCAQESGFSLFGQIARLSAPGAMVLAAATSHDEQVSVGLKRAGFLCEPLDPRMRVRDAATVSDVESSGFDVTFGLKARLRNTIHHSKQRRSVVREVAVVGGGVAGAGVAYALALRGHSVHVFDAALAHSKQGVHLGHHGAAVTPVVSRDDDYRARLSRAGARLAWQRWRSLPDQARPLKVGTAVIATDDDEQQRLHEALVNGSYPSSWASWSEPCTQNLLPTQKARRPWVHFPEGLMIRPGYLIEALLSHPGIHVHANDIAVIRPAASVSVRWEVCDSKGEVLVRVPEVVLANAGAVPTLLRNSGLEPLPSRLAAMQAIPGQVSYFDAHRFTTSFSQVLDGDGYWLPRLDGLHVGGGTYNLGANQAAVTTAGHAQVIDKISGVFDLMQVPTAEGVMPFDYHEALANAVTGGWAGWRAVVPGRLPVIGELDAYAGLWVACAYGSRGLTWSALAGEIISGMLNDEPLPLERELLRAIAPR